MPDADFLNFVVNLVKLGGLGVGALIFVMAFLILFRNQAATPDMARFRLSFLRWGSAFAVLALVASVTTELVKRPSGKVRLGVTISPDFGEAKLPPPVLVLMPGGTPIQPNSSTEISSDTTLAIQVRGIVENVKGLESSSQTLLATNQKLTEAIDKSSQVVHAASVATGPTASPSAAAAMTEIPVLSRTELANIKVTQNQISTGLAAGRFNDAARASASLHAMTANARGLDK